MMIFQRDITPKWRQRGQVSTVQLFLLLLFIIIIIIIIIIIMNPYMKLKSCF